MPYLRLCDEEGVLELHGVNKGVLMIDIAYTKIMKDLEWPDLPIRPSETAIVTQV